MNSIVLGFACLLAACLCFDIQPFPASRSSGPCRSDPCPYANMERRTGPAPSCDDNCDTVRAERAGKPKPPMICPASFFTNECHCVSGFVRKAPFEDECVAKEAC